MKPGDVVYFRRAKKESGPEGKFVEFVGHGFGVILGVLPPNQPAPNPVTLLRGMGQIGFLSFDDVKSILGDEMFEKCIEGYQDKYYGKVTELPPSPLLDSAKIAQEGEPL